jgi:hypothetical protein
VFDNPTRDTLLQMLITDVRDAVAPNATGTKLTPAGAPNPPFIRCKATD